MIITDIETLKIAMLLIFVFLGVYNFINEIKIYHVQKKNRYN